MIVSLSNQYLSVLLDFNGAARFTYSLCLSLACWTYSESGLIGCDALRIYDLDSRNLPVLNSRLYRNCRFLRLSIKNLFFHSWAGFCSASSVYDSSWNGVASGRTSAWLPQVGKVLPYWLEQVGSHKDPLWKHRHRPLHLALLLRISFHSLISSSSLISA